MNGKKKLFMELYAGVQSALNYFYLIGVINVIIGGFIFAANMNSEKTDLIVVGVVNIGIGVIFIGLAYWAGRTENPATPVYIGAGLWLLLQLFDLLSGTFVSSIISLGIKAYIVYYFFTTIRKLSQYQDLQSKLFLNPKFKQIVMWEMKKL